LKLGSYYEAKKNCKIKTQRICGNKRLGDLLKTVVTQAQEDNPSSRGLLEFPRDSLDAILSTEATRFNKTHFKDDIWIYSSSLGK